ncbi:MAG: Hsp20/alpha crystallin family protein, partial [Thermoplasmatota archaeon]
NLGDKYRIEADVPGIGKDNLDVEVREDRLTIKAEKEEEKEEKGEDYLRRERGYRSFYREIPLSDEVLSDEAEASLKNGVLRIDLPKKEPTKKEGRKLEIK